MVLPLPAFAFPLGFPSCIDPAGSGTICLAGCRKICLSTHRAYFLSHGGVLAGNGRFQCCIHRQHRFFKVPAISAGPPFIQHIARAVQRKADLILRVIVGAQLCNQLSDRSPFRAVQFSLCHNAYLSGALLCRPLEIPVISVTFLDCERASAIEFRFFCFGSW